MTISSAGHAYFALKDERNQLQCVWFRDDRLRSAFEPQAGLRVVAHGRIDLFEPQGALQLYVESIQPAGLGDLALRFEALKARLAAEGLFDAARKRPLPARPATIAVITSPTGAVWKDICHVLARRWPLTRVVLVAAQVQGEAAPASLVERVPEGRALRRRVPDAAGRPDEAPGGDDPGPRRRLARGPLGVQRRGGRPGGRRPQPARSCAGSATRSDVTLADFAADVRAPTPSAAAEIVVPDRAEVAGRRSAGAAAGSTPPPDSDCGRAGREVAAERRALERLEPGGPAGAGAGARRPAARPRHPGDRDRIAATGRLVERLARGSRRRCRRGCSRPGAARRVRRHGARRARRLAARAPSLGGAAAALAVLGPAGHARPRLRDRPARRGRRDRARPGRGAAGTQLALRVARGELPATADRADRRWPSSGSLSAVVFLGGRRRRRRSSAVRLGMLVAPRLDRLTEPRRRGRNGGRRTTDPADRRA